ncbi:MAG: LamG-like jellyroll fold domain-containing protein [Chloroflexota bacterium]
MQKNILPCSLIVVYTALALTAILLPVHTVQADEPISHWHLNESNEPFADAVGNNDGQCAGQCPAFVSDGKIGGAQMFSQTTGITISAATSFDWALDDDFSIELWVKAQPGLSCSGNNATLIGRADSDLHWSLGCTQDSGTPHFHLSDSGGISITLHGTNAITDGVWHHLVATRNGADMLNQLYVDGTEVASTSLTYTSNFASATAAINIGYLNNQQHFVGTLDEVSIHNTALTPLEIKSHFYLGRNALDVCGNPITIMPLGDSITEGHQSGVTDPDKKVAYRKDLWDELQQQGYVVDFVGSLTHGQFYQNEGFDPHHEGHSGLRADEIASNIFDTGSGGADWLTNNPADIVLLHIGTNDILQSQDVDQTAAEIEDILNKIDAFDENITVILARIINFRVQNASVSQLNDKIDVLVANRLIQGDKLILVNMEDDAGFIYDQQPNGDLFDDVHPFATGYTKMAAQWEKALVTFMPKCPSQPEIISTPSTTISQGQTFNYDVEASGYPTPTFQLESGPSGMTIVTQTGLIEWTPTFTGTYPITVTAINSAGDTTQHFVLSVIDAPNFVPGLTNYWTLDETNATLFNDQVNFANARCADSCPTADTGKLSGSQNFDGASTGLTVVANPLFDWAANDQFSISFWLKGTSGETCAEANEVMIGRDDASSKLHWWIGCEKETGKVLAVLRDTDADSSSEKEANFTGPAIIDGDWHFITFVRDGVTHQNKLYVDGLLADGKTVSFSEGFGSALEPLTIGWLNLGAQTFNFKGHIDDVALFDIALSADQIDQYYAAANDGNDYSGFYRPKFTTEPTLTASANITYTYNANAYGYPNPVFSLLSAPAGMEIHPTDGLISWNAITGTYDITVQALNTSGSDTQDFTLEVGAPLMCLPSLTSYWQLNETKGPHYQDLFGQMNGQCANGCPTSQPGIVANGQLFDGTASGISIPANGVFDWGKDDSFSIELWMQGIQGQTCVDGNEVLIGRDHDGAKNLHWWIGCSKNNGEAVVTLKNTSVAVEVG